MFFYFSLDINSVVIEANTEGQTIQGSTLTHHITQLKNARLVRQERHQTTLLCKMEYGQLDKLVEYLTEACCVDEVSDGI